MPELLQTLVDLVKVLNQLLAQLLELGMQHALLLVWLAWALFAINWKRTWPVLAEGAWAPVVLLTLLAALVWASLAPSSLLFLGFLPLGNFWWKLGAVWLILALTCFCGWLQSVWGCTPPDISTEPAIIGDGHDQGHRH